MADPIQNALFALQLFNNGFAPFGERKALQNKLAQEERDAAFKRELVASDYQKAVTLSNLQSDRARELAGYTQDREDSRQNAMSTRAEKNALAQLQRDEQRQKAADSLQDDRLNAADSKRLKEAITKEYALYAAEAENLGDEVLERAAFENNDNGLGKLIQIRAAQQRKRINRDQEGAADALVGERTAANSNIERLQREFKALAEPSPDEMKFAKADALKAIQMAVESGDLTGAKKLTSSGIKKGLDALAKGNEREAEAILGADVKAAYDGAVQQRLIGLQSSKASMQETQLKARELQQAVQYYDKFSTDLVKNAAANPFLARKLTTQRSGLDAMMAPTAPASRAAPRSFDQITPPMGTTAPVFPAVTAPTAPTPAASGGISALLGVGAPPAAATPPTYFDTNTLQRVPGERPPIVTDPTLDDGTRRNDAVADWMRGTAYGLTNLMRPSNWTGNADAVAYTPERGSLIPQMEARLAALDPRSPAAQELKAELERLRKLLQQ